MTRKDLIQRLIRLGLTKQQSLLAVDAFFNTLTDGLREGKNVSILGFGTWEWRERRGRISRHPKSGKKIPVNRRRILFFKPAQILKKKLKVDFRQGPSSGTA